MMIISDGMFGTVIIQLPSAYIGGEIMVIIIIELIYVISQVVPSSSHVLQHFMQIASMQLKK
jgi:hypothetical protein